MHRERAQGFTLLEILLVVAVIAILASIVIVAINPPKQLGDTRNAQRRSDVRAILDAVHQYGIANNGNFPTEIDSLPSTVQALGTSNTGCDSTCTAQASAIACVNLVGSLVPTFITSVPFDPKSGGAGNTDYYINKDINGRITVGSCDPEQGATISLTR